MNIVYREANPEMLNVFPQTGGDVLGVELSGAEEAAILANNLGRIVQTQTYQLDPFIDHFDSGVDKQLAYRLQANLTRELADMSPDEPITVRSLFPQMGKLIDMAARMPAREAKLPEAPNVYPSIDFDFFGEFAVTDQNSKEKADKSHLRDSKEFTHISIQDHKIYKRQKDLFNELKPKGGF